MHINDELFMHRALSLAHLGKGKVSPNPLVGCVIVHNNKIIGEGWHQQYGGPHAEVNAIASVEDSSLLSNSKAYVTLEPCAHYGKTPPCSDLLIKNNIREVIIGHKDPFPEVAGKGISQLQDAGISVKVGVLQDECHEINRRFFTSIIKKRPYIILKWAQTKDRFIARENYDSKWISNSYSRKLVHKWRTEEDAIMVGTNTALYDNPQLNVRSWKGQDPIRIVLDKELRLPQNLHLFDNSQTTLVYNCIKEDIDGSLVHIKLDPLSFMSDLLSDLDSKGVQSLFVEGGGQVISGLIQNDWWDEARVFTGQQSFEKGIAAPRLMGIASPTIKVLGDELMVYRNAR